MLNGANLKGRLSKGDPFLGHVTVRRFAERRPRLLRWTVFLFPFLKGPSPSERPFF